MDTTTASIRAMEPSVVETPTGWLALSPRMAPINIGVMGITREDAAAKFRESAEAWARLHDRPDPEPLGNV
jgi:hypothetical protein